MSAVILVVTRQHAGWGGGTKGIFCGCGLVQGVKVQMPDVFFLEDLGVKGLLPGG